MQQKMASKSLDVNKRLDTAETRRHFLLYK